MLPLALAACGFQPVYGPGGGGEALFGRVEVTDPNTVESYLLVQNLEQRLGRAADAQYRLDLNLSLTQQGQAITADNATTRFSLVGTLQYQLVQASTGQIAASGTISDFTGYSATGSTVETLAGERDARERLMVILADQLVARLFATADLAT